MLIVSAGFLASDFIMMQELPPILAREAAGELKVFPIFWSHCLADLEIAFTEERTGRRQTRKLVDFQGIGSPQEPLAGLSWSDCERKLTGLARRILALSGSETAPAAPAISWRGAAVPPAAGPAREHTLTVRLERRDDVLEVHYHLQGTDAIASAVRPWKEIAAEVAPIALALDRGGDFSIPASWGASLARVLFGPDSQWRPVLRALFGIPEPAAQPTPVRGPARLRVCTEDPLLAGLPWRLTSWNGRVLAEMSPGWIFEVSRTVDPTADMTTTAPCNVLVVAPAAASEAGKLHDPMHPKAIAEVLGSVWPTGRDPGYLHVVRTRRALATALDGMHPHVVYVYATGEVVGGRSRKRWTAASRTAAERPGAHDLRIEAPGHQEAHAPEGRDAHFVNRTFVVPSPFFVFRAAHPEAAGGNRDQIHQRLGLGRKGHLLDRLAAPGEPCRGRQEDHESCESRRPGQGRGQRKPGEPAEQQAAGRGLPGRNTVQPAQDGGEASRHRR